MEKHTLGKRYYYVGMPFVTHYEFITMHKPSLKLFLSTLYIDIEYSYGIQLALTDSIKHIIKLHV